MEEEARKERTSAHSRPARSSTCCGESRPERTRGRGQLGGGEAGQGGGVDAPPSQNGYTLGLLTTLFSASWSEGAPAEVVRVEAIAADAGRGHTGEGGGLVDVASGAERCRARRGRVWAAAGTAGATEHERGGASLRNRAESFGTPLPSLPALG